MMFSQTKKLLMLAATIAGLCIAPVRGAELSAAMKAMFTDALGEIGKLDLSKMLTKNEQNNTYVFNTAMDSNSSAVLDGIVKLNKRSTFFTKPVFSIFFLKTCAYFIHQYVVEMFSLKGFNVNDATNETQNDMKTALLTYIKAEMAKIDGCKAAQETFTIGTFGFKLTDIKADVFCDKFALRVANAKKLCRMTITTAKAQGITLEGLENMDVTYQDAQNKDQTKTFKQYVDYVIESLDKDMSGEMSKYIEESKKWYEDMSKQGKNKKGLFSTLTDYMKKGFFALVGQNVGNAVMPDIDDKVVDGLLADDNN